MKVEIYKNHNKIKKHGVKRKKKKKKLISHITKPMIYIYLYT